MSKSTFTVAAVAMFFAVSVPQSYSQSAMIDGEVTKIDASASKITLKHGPIKKFDMDGMSMVFRVQDSGVLTKLKVGDKVKFDADKINGQMTIVKIDKAR